MSKRRGNDKRARAEKLRRKLISFERRYKMTHASWIKWKKQMRAEGTGFKIDEAIRRALRR